MVYIGLVARNKPPIKNMQNKLNALIDHLKSLPSAAAGFSPVFLFSTAKTFKVPGRIIRESFLGNSKKLSPGKYGVDTVIVSEKPRKAYEKRADKGVTPKAQRAQKQTTGISNESLTDRKNLIMKLAKQHKADRDFVKTLNIVKTSTENVSQEAVDFAEEVQVLSKEFNSFSE